MLDYGQGATVNQKSAETGDDCISGIRSILPALSHPSGQQGVAKNSLVHGFPSLGERESKGPQQLQLLLQRILVFFTDVDPSSYSFLVPEVLHPRELELPSSSPSTHELELPLSVPSSSALHDGKPEHSYHHPLVPLNTCLCIQRIMSPPQLLKCIHATRYLPQVHTYNYGTRFPPLPPELTYPHIWSWSCCTPHLADDLMSPHKGHSLARP